MELTKERFIIIIAGGVIITVLGLYLFLYRPLINRLRGAHLECKTVEAEVLQAREAVVSLRAEPLKRGLISEEDISLAIDGLSRQGKLEGINFISITLRQIKRHRALYKILPIKMEIESTYEELGAFLGSLDDLEEALITVGSFNITPNKKGPERLRAKLVVNMHLAK